MQPQRPVYVVAGLLCVLLLFLGLWSREISVLDNASIESSSLSSSALSPNGSRANDYRDAAPTQATISEQGNDRDSFEKSVGGEEGGVGDEGRKEGEEEKEKGLAENQENEEDVKEVAEQEHEQQLGKEEVSEEKGSRTIGNSPSTFVGKPLRIMSYNVRVEDGKWDQERGWEHRKKYVIDLVRLYRPDIIGFQEVSYKQLLDLQRSFPAYGSVGVAREDGDREGEFSPLFFDESSISILNSSTFWLSETPDAVGSVGWDAKHPRIATWGLFAVPVGREVLQDCRARAPDGFSGRNATVTNINEDEERQRSRRRLRGTRHSCIGCEGGVEEVRGEVADDQTDQILIRGLITKPESRTNELPELRQEASELSTSLLASKQAEAIELDVELAPQTGRKDRNLSVSKLDTDIHAEHLKGIRSRRLDFGEDGEDFSLIMTSSGTTINSSTTSTPRSKTAPQSTKTSASSGPTPTDLFAGINNSDDRSRTVVAQDTTYHYKKPILQEKDPHCAESVFEYKEILHLNTHLDHKGNVSRSEAALRLHEAIVNISAVSTARRIVDHGSVQGLNRSFAGAIVTGDFNSEEGDEAYQTMIRPCVYGSHSSPCLRDAFFNSASSPLLTFAENFTESPSKRIDFIFVSRDMNVSYHHVATDRMSEQFYPSDHFPIFVDLEL